jgi:two-component system nitrate/nitrite response regulator NarL
MRAAERDRPDLALVDIGLPDRSGIAVGRDLLERWPGMTVVVVTALDDGHLVREALRVGFAGYLTKDTASGQFVRSLQSILDGQLVVPRKLANAANGAHGDDEAVRKTVSRLTEREREVLRLLADGASSEAIAEAFSITVNTARTHIQNVLTKLQVHSRLEAATFAVRHGLARPERSRARH